MPAVTGNPDKPVGDPVTTVVHEAVSRDIGMRFRT
jgi:hypothetical protein